MIQDEEYSELGSGISSIKTETSGFTNSQTSGFNSFTSETLGFFPTLESFPEFALNASVGKKVEWIFFLLFKIFLF